MMGGIQKFFICRRCDNLVGMIKDGGVPMECCTEDMDELVPNTVEASTEKHLPEVAVSGNGISVKVGSVPHPMEEAHHTSFVYVATERGGQLKCLKVGETPALSFSFSDDKPVAVYAYCNLHGLWKTDIKA